MLQQPPLKKISTDGAMGVVAVNSMQGGFAAAVGGSDAGLSAITQQMQNENVSGSSSGRKEKLDVQAQNASSLALAWKEETDGGRLLSPLFEHFGLSMFSFTPIPELSLFL